MNRNTDPQIVRFRVHRKVDVKLDTTVRVGFSIGCFNNSFVNEQYGVVVGLSIPDDNPDVREVTIRVD